MHAARHLAWKPIHSADRHNRRRFGGIYRKIRHMLRRSW
jgi:hypothetical protein